MLRIIGLQRADHAEQEFILLQNQGSMRVTLRGHALLGEGALVHGDLSGVSYAFSEDIQIPAGQYVILFSGTGIPRWAKTKDNHMIYHVYMGSRMPVWSSAPLPLHLLAPQHSYTERAEPALLMR
jgi:hypothetical protein